jgi:Major capsid protein Gp23
MGYLIDSGVVGNIGLKQLREQREIITNRWDKIGLLEGLDGNVRENCAQLFENQLSQMINESTDSANSGQFETVAFPVIRRVFAKLLANDIVSVQALNLPIGKLYYINPKASERVELSPNQYNNTSPDGAYSNAAELAPSARTQFEDRSLYDAFYASEYNEEGTSLFDRSKGNITVVTGGTTHAAWSVGEKQILLSLSGFTVDFQGKLIGPAGVPIDTESFLASLKIISDADFNAPAPYTDESIAAGNSLPFNVRVQKYGQAIVNKETGVIEIYADITYAGADGYQALSASSSAATFNYSYRVYSDLEEDSRMAEVTFTLDDVTVSVESRKMRAQWTPELAQDVSAFHNIDAEAELTALLSEQMAAEIDREILRDLRRGAAWTLRWDYNGLRKQSTSYYGTQKDWNQTLITKINQISAQIHKSTLRGGASWIVVSPEVSAVCDDLEYFHVSNAGPEQDKYNMGIEKIGTLSGRYQVYRDPYAPANTVLIGHKGNSILETGYIYAPYVPMQLTPVMYNPFDFTPVRGIMTRYAKKMVLNRYYGRIYCDGLQTFGIGELR